MEMGNMSKRQQPVQRADNSRGLPMGLQRSEKIPQPEVVLNLFIMKRKYNRNRNMYVKSRDNISKLDKTI